MYKFLLQSGFTKTQADILSTNQAVKNAHISEYTGPKEEAC